MIKKIINVSFLMIMFFLLVTPVFAAECTYKELETLEILAKKIQISHEFKGEREGNYLFYVTAHNLSDKFYLELPNGMKLKTNKSSEFLGSFYNNNKFNILVYASDKSACQDEALLSIMVDLPRFNEYSTREECVNNKNLEVCKEWYDSSNITEERFKQLIEKNENRGQQSSDSNWFNNIIGNWKIISMGLLFIILIIVVINFVRNKRRIKIDI